MFFRRLIALAGLAGIIALFSFNTTREYAKWTILFLMPAFVLYSRQRQYTKKQWQWWGFLLGIVILLTGYGFMMKDMPEHIVVRELTKQGDVYLAGGQFDKAIDRYKELNKHGEQAKAQRKIREVEVQKGFARKYEEADKLVKQGKYGEASVILQQIPRVAVVHGKARDLLDRIEGK
ncbi:MAG: hypothetical protein ACM3PP_02650 [Candidatus Saccharibacteria bacterium]